MIGWNPELVDYSKWPGLNAEKLRTALDGDQKKLNTLGYEAELVFINHADTAYDTVTAALKETVYDGVLIGAGVRAVPEHFIVFERLVNAVHQSAPRAIICFNTNPHDTAEAVQTLDIACEKLSPFREANCEAGRLSVVDYTLILFYAIQIPTKMRKANFRPGA